MKAFLKVTNSTKMSSYLLVIASILYGGAYIQGY